MGFYFTKLPHLNSQKSVENVIAGKDHVKTKPWNLSDSNIIAKTESSSAALMGDEVEKLDEQIRSMMTRTEKDITMGKQTGKAYACNECGKEGQWANIKTHIESNHIAGNISHSCDICGKISRSRNGLSQHKVKEHSKLMF